MEIVSLPLDGIRITGGTQPRIQTNEAIVAEYAEAIRAGIQMPPVVVFDDGAELWLADGFHRYHAHRHAGADAIACDVRQGTKRDAILFSVGANASHGLRRSNEDKRKAVLTVLGDEEWSTRSENWIAEVCKVSRTLVRAVIGELHLVEKQDAVRTVERNGATYQQNTANIGKPMLAPETPKAEGGMAAAPAVLPAPPAVLESAGPTGLRELAGSADAESIDSSVANSSRAKPMIGRPKTGHAADVTREALKVVGENDRLREELAEAQETAALLAEELQAYKAVSEGEAAKEIRALQTTNRALKSQLDDYIDQNAQLKRQIKAMQRQAGAVNA